VRIAGDQSTYAVRFCRRVRLKDHDPCPLCAKPLGDPTKAPRKTVGHDFTVATDYGEDWISVSTVSHILDKGGALSGWAYNLTVEGVLRLVATGVDVTRMDEEMLKAALKQAGFTPWVKKDRAASRGSEVHEVLERLAKGEDPSSVARTIADIDIEDFSPEEIRDVQNYALAAAHWFLDKKPRPILVEETVWSAESRTVGTLDILAERPDLSPRSKGVPVVLTDLKTSKDVYTDHAVQLDGYRLCLEEMVREGVVDVPLPTLHTVVLARPDSTYEERIVPSDPAAFVHALGLTKAAGRLEAALKADRRERGDSGRNPAHNHETERLESPRALALPPDEIVPDEAREEET